MTKANDLASLLDANGDVVSSALDNVPASDLVNDTTPQLGGNLDLNNNNITGTGNLNVTGTISSNKGSAGVLATFSDGVNSNFVVQTSSLLTTIGNGGGSTALALKANNTEAMRITSGNVGIGTSSPTSKLSVVSGTNAGITVNDGTVNTILFNTSSANGSLGTTTNHPMAFYANNAERMRILPTGGVTFNGDTAAANALDDYEEGNWYPQFGGSSTTGTGSYSHYVGRYVKVGKKVSCWGIIVSSGTHSGTGNLQITGLPFNKENTHLSWGTENSIGYHYGLTAFGTATNVIRLLGPVSNGAYLRFHSFANTGDTSLAPSPVHIQNGTSVYFATTYEVQ